MEVSYFDYNATTPVHPAVRDAMLPWLGERWGNPSSGHAYGRRAAAAVAEARARVAALINADSDEIVFTSGGTEADHLAVCGFPRALRRVVVSAVEHPAVETAAERLEAQGWTCDVLPVDGQGVVDLDAAREILRRPAGVVSVILAQNETGVLQPVAEVSQFAREGAAEVVVHTDAAQAVGKVPVDVEALGVDLLTVVGHKIYAPGGIGALWVRRGIRPEPLLSGGGQENGIRAGTEPVAAIVGLGAACHLASTDLEIEAARQRALRDTLWERLRVAIVGIQRTGEGADVLPGTLHIRFPGANGADVLQRAATVCASTGSACHGDAGGTRGTLAAMGLRPEDARGAVRLSIGRFTTAEDVERAAAELIEAYSAVKRRTA